MSYPKMTVVFVLDKQKMINTAEQYLLFKYCGYYLNLLNLF